MQEYAVLVLLGFMISTISSMAGIAGGVFMVPLFYFLGLSINEAVGTSKFVIIFTSLIASLNYLKMKKTPVRQGIYILIGMIPASFLSAYYMDILNSTVLKLIVSMFLIYYSSRLIHSYYTSRRPQVDPQKTQREISISLTKSITVGIVSGFIAGLTGTGGGAINMPLFLSFLKLPIHTAIALSVFTIFPSALVAAIKHMVANEINYAIAIPFIIGVIIGSNIGPRISTKLSRQKLKLVISIVLIIVAIRMLLTTMYPYNLIK
ncbi:MAG: sulfite exporter TauE/SafE family protein [Staphylothermus sp.]|nr:sulfite exporter TauE/SafE family protein [Staphylothermus sp.]